MKVLMINVTCGVRSTGRICTNLASSLELEGHEVKIAYGRKEVPFEFQKYAVKIGNYLDIAMHGVFARIFDASGFGSKRATKVFVEWIKEYNPDIIHLHNIHGYYLHVGVLFNYLKNCNKRIIWTIHDMWPLTGHTAYCDSINCTLWIEGCNNCPLLNKYPRSLFDNSKKNWYLKKGAFCGLNNLTIVTPSFWLAEQVKKSYLKNYAVRVINNGINTNIFKPSINTFRKEHGLENKFLILGAATVWDNMKGLDDFIKISKILDGNYKIILIGLSKKQIHQMPKKIMCIERTNNIHKLVEIYTAVDLFLNLTYCESFGQVNVESALCGTPIIAYDTGGCRESVGKCGKIVPKGDLYSVVSEIVEYKNHPPTLNIDREALDTKTSVKKYIETYKMK